MQPPLFHDELPYREVKDGDPLARNLVDKHYSRRWRGKPGTALTLGPGWKMVLLGVAADWVFGWRKTLYRLDGQKGVECAYFHNESRALSSSLILACEAAWDERHGATRKFTYVHPAFVRSRIPGYCFLKAGWVRDEGYVSPRGLIRYFKEVAG